ncbi:MAG: 3-hydroxyacyl-CoA dehydrogenase/enoyl-CoA hydratase family protein [Bacteroidota bacterium]
MKLIRTVGVVGAGTMGAALAQKFAQENFKVILADREMAFVQKGITNITNMLNEGLERKVFSADQVSSYLSNITGTATLADLSVCDIIIEAIFENFDAKTDLFRNLDKIIGPDTILATNTSSFSVDELAKSVSHPERFIGLHYFYHAAKNRLVEIIPGKKTSEETFQRAQIFSVQSGKDAIICRDSYGFVVNRFFVPWLNESVRLFDENVANIATIDDVCMKVFGIGMGPFALMNATGVPVAYHAQKTLEVYGNFYHVSNRLKYQVDLKENWDLQGEISTDEKVRKTISDRMMGVVYLVCTQLLDENVCTAVDINKGARIGLRWSKGPIEMMQKTGEGGVRVLIHKLVKRYDIASPSSIGSYHWKMNYVTLDIKNKAAIITINRPEDLNALNEEVVKQFEDRFIVADNNADVDTIFLVGSGKAFVAGADIKFFVKNIKSDRINDIEGFTAYGQQVFDRIDRSKKKVVAIINGLALGGGLEMALCADVILALPKAMLAFPETGIGIYPGLGGTQRTAKKIGKSLAKYLILTGKMLSAKDALEIGLVDNVISQEEMFEILNGDKAVVVNKLSLSDKWTNIQHFFDQNTVSGILSHQYTTNGMKSEDAEKISNIIKHKAPVAVSLADKLISEAQGCDSELKHLREILPLLMPYWGSLLLGRK